MNRPVLELVNTLEEDVDVEAEALRAGWTRARQAHPEVPLSASLFEAAFHAASSENGDPEGPIVDDLYLACACASGADGAATKFHSLYAAPIRRAVSRVISSESMREEVVQRTFQILLTGHKPKISQYKGRGPLARWVAVVATRVAVSSGRAESADKRLQRSLIDGAHDVADPESELVRHELREVVEQSIKRALARLEDRDRLILRLNIVSGMSNSAIARTFGVNHSTVGRRIADIRRRLLDEVTRDLRPHCLQAEDLASMFQALGRLIDVSISRL